MPPEGEHLRRDTDNALITLLEKVMIEDSNFKLKIQEAIDKLIKNQELMQQQVEGISKTQGSIKQVLWGDLENMGQGGVVATVNSMTRTVDNTKWFFTWLVGAAAVIISMIDWGLRKMSKG